MFARFLPIAVVAFILMPAFSSAGQSKEQQMKQAFDELKAEVVVLERQIRSMQESIDRNSGQMTTLITQIVDNVNAIRQSQSRQYEAVSGAIGSVGGLGEQIGSTNRRIDRVSEQVAELKRIVENLPKLPAFTSITPGNPDQLFAAAYADFSRGNYDLAVSEFRQYVETYPTSEMADNAQFWIAECLYAKKKLDEAVVEYDKVVVQFPKGDRVPAARYKKGLVLMEQGQPEAARAEFQAIIRLFPRSNEAVLARQQLGDR
jgi:tol-pal system protein YbgF